MEAAPGILHAVYFGPAAFFFAAFAGHCNTDILFHAAALCAALHHGKFFALADKLCILGIAEALALSKATRPQPDLFFLSVFAAKHCQLFARGKPGSTDIAVIFHAEAVQLHGAHTSMLSF